MIIKLLCRQAALYVIALIDMRIVQDRSSSERGHIGYEGKQCLRTRTSLDQSLHRFPSCPSTLRNERSAVMFQEGRMAL